MRRLWVQVSIKAKDTSAIDCRKKNTMPEGTYMIKTQRLVQPRGSGMSGICPEQAHAAGHGRLPHRRAETPFDNLEENLYENEGER